MTYQIVTELTDAQISDLLELYSQEYWSSQRTREAVVQMLASSDLIVGLVDEDDRLVGFTRVLTDFVFRAVVFDVVVKPSLRGQGLGRKLLDALIHHPQLQTVEVIALACLPEMVPFYERWGFTAGTEALMLKGRSDALIGQNLGH